MHSVIRPTCCGRFPEMVCGDCPHANDEQRGNATVFRHEGPMPVHQGMRCDTCFLPWDKHVDSVCPTATKPPPPPVEVVVIPVAAPVAAPVVPPKPRVSYCSSCGKPWNGQRVARGPEGLHCGTCNQQTVYS